MQNVHGDTPWWINKPYNPETNHPKWVYKLNTWAKRKAYRWLELYVNMDSCLNDARGLFCQI